MGRQKVKGTGHKQPADASSEPDFYLMDSLGPPTPISSHDNSVAKKYPTHGFVLADTNAATDGGVLHSPGMQSVHGAAHLLQGIASGMTVPSHNLGPSAAEYSLGSSAISLQRRGPSSSFLPEMPSDPGVEPV
jgi:hypothetical protein